MKVSHKRLQSRPLVAVVTRELKDGSEVLRHAERVSRQPHSLTQVKLGFKKEFVELRVMRDNQ
ncbi:MAG: hypothetical protein ABFD13_04535 [Candidatus Cryosericum sp.]